MHTQKRELENYLHPDAIKRIAPGFPDTINDFDDVSELLAQTIHSSSPSAQPWANLAPKQIKEKVSNAKRRLNQESIKEMTCERFAESDPSGELVDWLRQIGEFL